MAKRKATEAGLCGSKDEPRRSSRRTSAVVKEEIRPEIDGASTPAKKGAKRGKAAAKVVEKVASEDEGGESPVDDGSEEEKMVVKKAPPKSSKASKSSKSKPIKSTTNGATDSLTPSGRQYWLMKAEPESRIEKGHDIKFSINDLAAKTEPEPWDGIRNYAARNNLRAMKKGDQAFFYHSSCKVPAIVGTMDIVEEHTPDLSAHDSSKPYYDPNSKPDDPKWSVVHVMFRQKLKTPITLKELKEWQTQKGHSLENMQMLKLARMSVSKVSAEEWEFLVGEMKKRGDEVK
ncbi:hypothetical protein HYALB_00002677 [Hymenoscyphus albidus]|uniref:Thymocyte nuclear protein 1 n=1 Tax=Hymenoscyphus albidus TaxID=595503 RepID=A0A9N9M519_9HELO|nr:hypothetical protein HYALB_00002677 [Hymenoscyphus albidus]